MLQAILSEIDSVASRLSVSSLSMLPSDHELHQYSRKLLALLVAEQQQQQQQAGYADATILMVSKQIFAALFSALETPIRFELYFYLLEGIQTVCSRLRKELTSWFLYLDDEVRQPNSLCC
jgi:hypothetical protein